MNPKQLGTEINKQAAILGFSGKQFEDAAMSYLMFNCWKSYGALTNSRKAKSLIKKLGGYVPFNMSFDGKAKKLADAVKLGFNGDITNANVLSISLEGIRAFIQQKRGAEASNKFEAAANRLLKAGA